METQTLTEKKPKKTKTRKFLRFLYIAVPVLLLISLIAHLVWKNSGSEQWELITDNNGIKIWSKKIPGHTLVQYKAQMRVKSKLSSAVFYVTDDSNNEFGSYDMNVLEKIDSPERFWAYYAYKVAMPWPIGHMDAVILIYYNQDPKTKVVDVNVLAAPNKTPRIKDSFRLSHMNDIWTLKPLPNGEVDVELLMDLDAGIPYFLFNTLGKEDIEKNFNLMRTLLNTDKYKNVNRPYIKEYNQ